jgi:tetratricopeptide (TPR) repeat protein
MGDGVLAYFGYPRAHEDEAERAVRAGLALVQTVGQLKAPTGEALAARVGIATGLVVVGDLVGEGAAQEQAMVGDTPNFAARLQSIAASGQVVIADATRRLLGAGFDLEDLGQRKLKGISEPVAAFAVKGELALASRFEARTGSSLLPMVGRDQELALLSDRWVQAKAGEGQGVLLVGEAGIGKSRIGRALVDAVAEEPHTRIRYQCSPYHRDSALWPVVQQLTHAAGIASDDATDARLDKLEALLARANGAADTAPLIADLLGLDAAARYGELNLTPQAQRARTLRALVDQLVGLAAREPVLMLLEDTHWIDPTTLELIEQCLDQIADRRVLILLTSRPDHQPELAAHPHVTRLTLNRLGRAGVEAIVARLGGKDLAPDVVGRIIARTDGVPLFVEELTKAILESGETTIPASLHDSLMARLDRIPEVKEVAQIAACIGREFGYSLLAAVADRPQADLRYALDKLATAELIFRRGSPPEAHYVFKHALVQETAYASLLNRKRRLLHEQVACALEELQTETVAAEPELLARHLTAAGLFDRAVEYWRKAGRQALHRSAAAEAVSHLRRAAELLMSAPGGKDRDTKELSTQTDLGAALILAKGYADPDTGRTFARARELAEALGDRDQAGRALYGQTLFHMDSGRLGAALEVAEHLLSIAEGDEVAELLGHRLVGTCNMHMGRWRTALHHHEAALRLHDSGRHSYLRFSYAQDQGVTVRAHLAWSLVALGWVEQSRIQAEKALSLAARLNHPHTLAFALHAVCRSRQFARDQEDCRRLGAELQSLAVEHNFAFHGCGGLSAIGSALLAEGEAEEAERLLNEALAGYSQAHSGYLLPLVLGEVARAQHAMGKMSAALDSVRRGLAIVEANDERSDEASLLTLQGEILLAGGESDLAEGCLRKAISVAHEQEARLFELRAATALTRLWVDQGKRAEAHDLLGPVYGWFTEGFDTADLKDAKALLDELA